MNSTSCSISGSKLVSLIFYRWRQYYDVSDWTILPFCIIKKNDWHEMCSGNSTNTSLVMSGQISQQSCFSRGIRTHYFPEQWWADAYSCLINIWMCVECTRKSKPALLEPAHSCFGLGLYRFLGFVEYRYSWIRFMWTFKTLRINSLLFLGSCEMKKFAGSSCTKPITI